MVKMASFNKILLVWNIDLFFLLSKHLDEKMLLNQTFIVLYDLSL